jgi:hypothetical protein
VRCVCEGPPAGDAPSGDPEKSASYPERIKKTSSD